MFLYNILYNIFLFRIHNIIIYIYIYEVFLMAVNDSIYTKRGGITQFLPWMLNSESSDWIQSVRAFALKIWSTGLSSPPWPSLTSALTCDLCDRLYVDSLTPSWRESQCGVRNALEWVLCFSMHSCIYHWLCMSQHTETSLTEHNNIWAKFI